MYLKRLYGFCTLCMLTLHACVTLPSQAQLSATPREVDVAPNVPAPEMPSPAPQDGSAPLPDERKPIEMPQGAVIVFKRSGGLAGLNEEWTIYPDGRVTGADGAVFQVQAQAVSDLLAKLTALDLSALAGDYIPLNACCDRIFYELIIALQGQTVRIKTADGVSGVPEAVWRRAGFG